MKQARQTFMRMAPWAMLFGGTLLWIPNPAWPLRVFAAAALGATALSVRRCWKKTETEKAELWEIVEGYRTMARETSALVSQCLSRSAGEYSTAEVATKLQARELEEEQAAYEEEAASEGAPLSPAILRRWEALLGPEKLSFEQAASVAIRKSKALGRPLSMCVCRVQALEPRVATPDEMDEISAAFLQLVTPLMKPDWVLRQWGERDFAFLLPQMTAIEAGIWLERVRCRWQTMAFGLTSGIPFAVEARCGVTKWDDKMSTADFLLQGRQLLEDARRIGGSLTVAQS